MALGVLAVVSTLQLLGTCAAVATGIRLQVLFAGAVPTSTAGGLFGGSSAEAVLASLLSVLGNLS